jgi:hypothetical protein
MNAHAEHVNTVSANAQAGCPECRALLNEGIDRWFAAREADDSSVIVRILSLADGSPTSFDNQWLVDYDLSRPGITPDGDLLTAHVETTRDRTQARRFADFRTAIAVLSQPSGRTRADGEPDRPMTAFNLSVERASECL